MNAITVNDALAMALPLSVGFVLGVFFFAGLWWTVRRLADVQTPAVWMLCSLLVRLAVTAAGFWLVTGGRFERALACLAGFVAARLVVTWFTRQMPAPPEEAHAAQP